MRPAKDPKILDRAGSAQRAGRRWSSSTFQVLAQRWPSGPRQVHDDRLYDLMAQGRTATAEKEEVKALLAGVFKERYHSSDWDRFRTRAFVSKDVKDAAYSGLIIAENDDSGAYQGTSFVWFPGDRGSVAVLVIGTGGFGPDAHILARQGHRRRLRALQRIHRALWVKPDLLDLGSAVPEAATREWPRIEKALQTYGKVIYAAVAVQGDTSRAAVRDLLDLFAHEHAVRFKGEAKAEWDTLRTQMLARLFPRHTQEEVAALLTDRRFVILQGPPGTGKTRLALRVARRFGDPTFIQFHPARTYEDFVIGLAPRPAAGGLAFEVRAGDLLRANQAARGKKHVLVIDELNRGDLARVLGEAITLFEPSEPDRSVDLPHAIGPGGERRFQLEPGLMVLGTLNTADRSIAHIDLAIRRRFAFLDLWPDLDVVRQQGDPLATAAFEDALDTFSEHAGDAGLALVPGHAYFLDPRPDASPDERGARIRSRLRHELLPLLRTYVDERLIGPATSEVAGLADRIEASLETVIA
jgi:5-methylcytosine-specific restriction enzyme B